jgi:hypothetical protein
MTVGSNVKTLRRVRLILGLPGWLLVTAILVWHLARLASPAYRLGPEVENAAFAVALVTMALFLASFAGLFVLRVPCPNCGERFFEGNYHPFFLKAPFAILFMHECRHCRLSIGKVGAPPPGPSLERR